jgi:hypothetical protein
MALTENREVEHYVDQELRSLPVAADVHIYKGALLGLTSGGYLRPLTAGDLFAGLAYEEADNTGGANGDTSVRFYTLGDFSHALSGVAMSNIGDPVYASADDTLTLTSTANSYVGRAIDVPSAGQIILRLDTLRSAP